MGQQRTWYSQSQMLKNCCQILNKSLVPFVSTPKSVKCLFNVFLSHCLPLEAGVPGPLNPKNQCSGYLVLDPFVSSRIGKVFISSIFLLVLEFPDDFLHLLLPQFRHIVANKETSKTQPTNKNPVLHQREDLKFAVPVPSTRWCSAFSVFILHLEN